MYRFILAFIFLISIVTPAQDGLKKLQNKYNSFNDFSVAFQQSGTGNSSGRVTFKKGNKLRIEMKHLTIVSDGTTVWSYNNRDDKVIISQFDEEDPSVLSFNRFVFDYPASASVTYSGSTMVLTGKSGADFKKAVLTHDANYLLTKVEITDKSNKTTVFEFNAYKTNSGISDNQFTFTPGKGTTIVDLR